MRGFRCGNKYESSHCQPNQEIKDLILFKKALFQSDFINETELLKTLNPLLSTESIWKSHALLLLGDYFFSKKEYLKAKEFYLEILTLKNLNQEFYIRAQSQISFISNE